MSPMRVAHSVKLLAVHRRREAVVSETAGDKNKVRVWLFVLEMKCPAVTMTICPVHHSDYNECGDSVADILLEGTLE